jgi:hypothetical protein
MENEDVKKFNEYIARKYLNFKCLDDTIERTAIIKSGIKWISFKGKDKPEIEVLFDGAKYLHTVNKQSGRNLKEAFGSDSINWINQKVELTIKLVNGKEALIIEVPK